MTKGRTAPRILPDDGACHLARDVQEACLRAALDGYEQASLSGLWFRPRDWSRSARTGLRATLSIEVRAPLSAVG